MTPHREWNRLLDALASEPRRQLVASLLEASDQEWLALPDAATSAHTPGPEILEITLKHNHLPKLEKAGYVRWERDPFIVRRGPRFHLIGGVVRAALDHADAFPDELVSSYDLFSDRRRR
jgi:hypothetical protein